MAAGNGYQVFALARYTPNGTLDPMFGTGGKVTTTFAGSSTPSFAVAIQADAKIVAAGGAGTGGGSFALARYNPDGSLDPTFGTGGKVTTDFAGGYAFAASVAIQRGWQDRRRGLHPFFNGFELARYKPDGTLDPTFGTGGEGDHRLPWQRRWPWPSRGTPKS